MHVQELAGRSHGLASLVHYCSQVTSHQCDQIGGFIELWATF